MPPKGHKSKKKENAKIWKLIFWADATLNCSMVQPPTHSNNLDQIEEYHYHSPEIETQAATATEDVISIKIWVENKCGQGVSPFAHHYYFS